MCVCVILKVMLFSNPQITIKQLLNIEEININKTLLSYTKEPDSVMELIPLYPVKSN